MSEKLAYPSGLDGGYLYFKELVEHLEYPDAFRIERLFRQSRQGRRYYGACISKPDWHPAKMKEANNKFRVDPSRNFNIHFEPQYNVLNNRFSLYVHYEVYPYLPEKKARERIRRQDYDAYLERRADFIKRLKSTKIPGLRIGGRSNQIAKATFDFRSLTYAEVRDRIEPLMSEIAAHIDNTLDDMR